MEPTVHDSLPAPGLTGLLPDLRRWLRARERLDALGDRELAERAARGDARAFGELYHRYLNDVLRYLLLRVGDRALAEDLTQDVFTSAFRAMPLFQWQGPIRPWFLRCAHNRVANHWRSVQRSPRQAELPDAADEDRDARELADPTDSIQGLLTRLGSEGLLRAMETLTPLRREVLALRFGAELSVAETAEWMGRSEAAVKNLQFAALGALRARLLEKGEGA